jgi:glycosyltransferase involved in cell wall biosynthesis
MQNPFFSIIITTHCRPKLLSRAIESITAQTFDDTEIIVVSDSEDKLTFDVAKNELRTKDVFIRRAGAPGPARSRNIGLELARGKVCLMLDDDDSFTIDFLEKLRAHIAATQSDVFYFNFEYITESRLEDPPKVVERSRQYTDRQALDDIMISNFIPNNAIAMSASVANRFRFDETLRSHEDWDFLVAMMYAGCKFTHLPIFGPCVHLDPNSSQRNKSASDEGNRRFDYLHIYRRWPAIASDLRERRYNMLKQIGFDVPSAFL